MRINNYVTALSALQRSTLPAEPQFLYLCSQCPVRWREVRRYPLTLDLLLYAVNPCRFIACASPGQTLALPDSAVVLLYEGLIAHV